MVMQMTEESERSIESYPKIEINVDSRNKILRFQDLLQEKPRVSVEEIEGMDRLIRMVQWILWMTDAKNCIYSVCNIDIDSSRFSPGTGSGR